MAQGTIFTSYNKHNGKEYEKACICITESLCCVAVIAEQCNSTIIQ